MSQLTINLVQGAITFNFTPQAAENLKAEIAILVSSLKTIANHSGGRPVPQKTMEYRHTGDIFLEVFCNPNIYPSTFAAKVLLTVRDDRLKVTTEAELTRLIEDLSNYLEQS